MSRSFFAPSVIRAVSSLEAMFAAIATVATPDHKCAVAAQKVRDEEAHNYQRYADGYSELTEGSFFRDVQELAEQRRIERKMKAQARNAAKARMNAQLDQLVFA